MYKILRVVLSVCVICCVDEALADLNRLGGTVQYWLNASEASYRPRASSTNEKIDRDKRNKSMTGVELAFEVATKLVGNGVARDVMQRIDDFTSGGHRRYNGRGTAESQNFVVMVVKLVDAMANYVIDDSVEAWSVKNICASKFEGDKWWQKTGTSDTVDAKHNPIEDCELYMTGFKLANYIGQVDGALRCMANPGRTKNDLNTSSGAPGIVRVGNACYINSTYQILVRIPGVYESFARRNEEVDSVHVRASWLMMSQLLYCCKPRSAVMEDLVCQMIGSSGLYSARKQNDALEFFSEVSGYLERGSERGFVANTTLATREVVTREIVTNAEGGASKGRSERAADQFGCIDVDSKGRDSGVIKALNGSVEELQDDYCFGDDYHKSKAQQECMCANLPKYPMIRIAQLEIDGDGQRRRITPEHGRKVPKAIPYGFRRSGGVWAACNKDGEICDENGKVNGENPDNEQFYLLRMALIHDGEANSGHYWMVYLAKDHSGGIVVNDGSCSKISLKGAIRNITFGAYALFYELQEREPAAQSGEKTT